VAECQVGVLGATSLVGGCLLPILVGAGYKVSSFSRRRPLPFGEGVRWYDVGEEKWTRLDFCICVAPIWTLPTYFDRLDQLDLRRVVVLSSTSRFTKGDSSDNDEQAVARRLRDCEERFQAWAESRDIEWVILRPTLIYGRGRDKNVAEIARIIKRFGFFPLLGKAQGMRQPVHAEDVATACLAALSSPEARNRSYDLSGAETLAYRDMVSRVFASLGLRPRFLHLPLSIFRMMITCMRYASRYRHWSPTMAERMNRDLAFDHSAAARDLKFSPRPFLLTGDDLPA